MDWFNSAKELRAQDPDKWTYRTLGEMFNRTESAVKDRFYLERKQNKVKLVDKKEYSEADVDNYINQYMALQEAADRLNTKQVKTTIKLEVDRPTGLAFWGDWHTGGIGVDYRGMREDGEKIAECENLYWGGMGDYKDNYHPQRHPSAQYEQSIPPGMQDMIVLRDMERYGDSNVFLIRGCHDDWDKADGDKDFVQACCNVMPNSINLWHGGEVKLQVGDEEYLLRVRHKYPFESKLNVENSMRRINEVQGESDVAFSAHLHNPFIMQRHLMGDYRILGRSGSYKIWDEFGQKLAGYKGKRGVPVVVFYPDEHRMVDFLFLDDAIKFLKSV